MKYKAIATTTILVLSSILVWHVLSHDRISLKDEIKLHQRLIYACEHGSMEDVARLINQGARVELYEYNKRFDEIIYFVSGKSAIMASVRNSDPRVVAALLDAGVNPHVRDKYGHTALWYARDNKSIQGSIELRRLKELILPPADEQLIEVVKDGSAFEIRTILALGASVDARTVDADAFTPLMIAAIHNTDQGALEVLVSSGAKINQRSWNGYTALHLAVSSENTAAITYLLENGADPSLRTDNGQTPLDIAAPWTSNDVIIKALLESGSRVNESSGSGMATLMRAAMNKNKSISRLLLSAGADPNLVTREGSTALMYAARVNSNPDVIAELLAAGANPIAADEAGKTALDYAEQNEALQGTEALERLRQATEKARTP